MISEKDQEIISYYAKKYNVAKVFLIGNSSGDKNQLDDIDLAAAGIKPELFNKFYGKLLRNLSKPCNLIGILKKSDFRKYVGRKAVKIYDDLTNKEYDWIK
ncbi:MAG: hypothetical protein LUQ65_08420 [Candidatus Helarchaeota archaeon]|nr:hypothetical protein [Candidatus Helarchaeota archaeon]